MEVSLRLVPKVVNISRHGLFAVGREQPCLVFTCFKWHNFLNAGFTIPHLTASPLYTYFPPFHRFDIMPRHSTRNSQSSDCTRTRTRSSCARTARPRGNDTKNKTEEQRIAYLKSSRYAKSVSEQGVDCAACEKHIKLDKRNGYKYYAENWTKHLNTKKCIENQKLFDIAETQVGEYLKILMNVGTDHPCSIIR